MGSDLTLTNDVVRDNQAVGLASVSALGYPGVGAGGGINNLQGVVTITDCTVEDNEAHRERMGRSSASAPEAPSITPRAT